MLGFNFFKHRTVEPEAPKAPETAWTIPSLTASIGKAFEAYNPDQLVWRKGTGIYAKMLHDDQIKASLGLYITLVIGRPWRFKVDSSNPKHPEIAEFFEYNLEKFLEGTLGSVLRGILSARQYGFSVSEKVWEAIDFEGREAWMVKSIRLKPQQTFSVELDDLGNIEKLIQSQGGKRVELDYRKFIHYVNRVEVHPFYGESELRGIYDPYWAKQLIRKLWFIWLERLAGGFILAKTPSGLSTPETERLERALVNLNVNTALRVPTGVEVDIIHAPTTEAFEKAEAKQNIAISRGLLVPGLLGFTEQVAIGSLARAEIEAETFANIVKEEGEHLADVLNEQFFRELAWYNFGEKDPPLFVFEPQTEEQKQGLVKVWLEVIAKGAATVNLNDENRVRNLLGFDEVEKRENGESEERKESEENEKEPTASFAKQSFRIDFAQRKRKLDRIEAKFETELTASLQSIADKIQLKAAKILKLKVPDAEGLEEAVAGKPRQGLKKTIQVNLENAYDFGRKNALQVIEEAAREKGKSFGFVDFQRKTLAGGISVEASEAFFESLSFQIAKDSSGDLLRKVSPILARAIQSGMTEEEMLTEMDSAVKSQLGTDKVGSRVQAIVRTNVTNLFVQAQLSVYNDPELGGFVEALQYVIVNDRRTTPFCLGYEGFVAPLNDSIWGQIAPPNHYLCRSDIIPLVQGDKWTQSEKLPKAGGDLLQPGDGFGTVG